MIRSSSDATPIRNVRGLGHLDLLYLLDDYISTHPTSPFAAHIDSRLSTGYAPLRSQGMELSMMDFAAANNLSSIEYTLFHLPTLVNLLPDLQKIVREALLKKDTSSHDGVEPDMELETDRLKEDIDELICRLNEVEVELKMIRENL